MSFHCIFLLSRICKYQKANFCATPMYTVDMIGLLENRSRTNACAVVYKLVLKAHALAVPGRFSFVLEQT